MRVCKLMPGNRICGNCRFESIVNDVDLNNCENCDICTRNYEVVDIGVGTFGKPYVLLIKDGKIEKFNANEVYDIKYAFNYISCSGGSNATSDI